MFTSEAFLQSPLTFDHKHLMSLSISSLSTNQISNTGTDFAPPLRIALEKHLSESETNGKQSKNSKVILLISDGEDFGKETSEIANDIKEEGIKLFTLGIGTKSGGKIPQGNRYLTDKTGSEVVSKLNAKSLEKLADMTKGDYFEISDGRNDVAKLITAISKIKGEFRDARDIDTSANRYFYFLLVALILMIADVLITVKIIRI
jgi:Ca-activated chloride channel family protein